MDADVRPLEIFRREAVEFYAWLGFFSGWTESQLDFRLVYTPRVGWGGGWNHPDLAIIEQDTTHALRLDLEGPEISGYGNYTWALEELAGITRGRLDRRRSKRSRS